MRSVRFGSAACSLSSFTRPERVEPFDDFGTAGQRFLGRLGPVASSGEAGAILQKLRTYRIRLAVVCPPDGARLSSRFGEMAVEEKRTGNFGLFESASEAQAWLAVG